MSDCHDAAPIARYKVAMFTKIVLTACALLCATPAMAAEKRVYKIDGVIATLKDGVLTVQAKGAVQTGGWTNLRLHVAHSDGRAVTIEFLATPPPPAMTVVAALMPVTVSAKFKTRGKLASVAVAGEVNEVTSQVLH
jgi:hypothetical protein